jgi:hypothetical protein
MINLLVGLPLQWSLEVAHWEERRQPAFVPTGVERRRGSAWSTGRLQYHR